MPEQLAGGFGPDVLTLQRPKDRTENRDTTDDDQGGQTKTRTRPNTRFVVELDEEYYRRRKSSVVIRHASGDQIIAVIEIVSPGNKSSRSAFRPFVEKACQLIENRIHLLVIDPFPPGARDPVGVHAAIWEELQGAFSEFIPEKPLTLVSYECDFTTRAHLEPIAIGDRLPDIPLFLAPGVDVVIPLEETYCAAFAVMPRRWAEVLESMP